MARIYEEVKGRPLYIISEAINLPPDSRPPARAMRLMRPAGRRRFPHEVELCSERPCRQRAGAVNPKANGDGPMTEPAENTALPRPGQRAGHGDAAGRRLPLHAVPDVRGGGPPGPMGMGGPSRYLQDWLHSFRMPLFFLISGFFGRMMLEKYGTGNTCGSDGCGSECPLLVGMFTFGPAVHIDP